MKYLVLLALLCPASLYAQTDVSLYDGMYSKEWEQERDALNNDKQQPAASQRANQHWIMNGGLHPDMTPSGMTSGYKRKGTGTRSTGTRSSSYSSDFLERRREAMDRAREEARRKERERKERIARENAADFRNGYNAKMATSEAYYNEKRANDQYRMGEGARKLDESMRSSDFATIPEMRPDSYTVSEENELLDLMQNGMTEPGHKKLHVNADGHYDILADPDIISDKVDEALAAHRRQEAGKARQNALRHLESLRESHFDFSSLATVIPNSAHDAEGSTTPKATTSARQGSGLDKKPQTDVDMKKGAEAETPNSDQPKKHCTYEEYLYRLNQGEDFSPEEWIEFNKMIEDKEKKVEDKEDDIHQQQQEMTRQNKTR